MTMNPDPAPQEGPRSGNGLDQESLWRALWSGGKPLDRAPRGRPLPSGEASYDAELSELANIRSKNRFSVSVLATGPTA